MRKLIIIYITLALPFLVMLFGCNHKTKAWDKMDMADRLMNSRPDSAMTILSSIANNALGNDVEKARYALLMSMALDKNYIDTTSFDVLQPAINYYLKKGSADEILRTLYYQGRIYQNMKNYDLAMRSFMRGREYFGQTSDTLAMANLLVAQGTILYTTYKLDDFIKVNLEAAELYRKMDRPDYEILSIANALDGCIVNNSKNRADSIMTIVHNRVSKKPEYTSDISPYILSYAIKFGDKEDIVDLLEHCDSADTLDDMTKIDVAQAYCKIGNNVKANQLLNMIDSTSVAKQSLKYLAVKTDILEQTGDYAGALIAYRNFSTTLDSIHQNIFSHDLLFAKERHEMEKSNLLMIQQRNKLIWLTLCVAFVLLIIAGYIYYRYRLSKAKNLLEEQENQRLLLEQENLKRDNENLELRNHQAELEKKNLQQANEKLEFARHNAVLEKQAAELEKKNLQQANEKLELERQNAVLEKQAAELEKKNLQQANEKLELERQNAVLEKQAAELEKKNLQQANEKLELERHNAILEKQAAELECERQSLASENLRLKVEQLENESSSLKDILEKRKDLAKPIEEAIKIRIEMLNGLLATQITDNNTYAQPYSIWCDKLVQDKDEFMNTTRLAFKASHPRFIEYLEEHDLTETEINYLCLYAMGLRGKEAGEYIQLKRHYHISSNIRKKLGIDEHQTNIGIYIRKLMKKL